MNGQCRQAVGDHNHQIDPARMRRSVITQGLCRRVTQLSSQVRALQVTVAVDRCAVQQKAFVSAFGQL
ncbi:hypothetical protein D3C72_706550 [compost metagenome]